MALNLAWVKEHKVAVAGVFLGALVVIYLASKKGGSSSSSGVAGVLQSAQAGQLQMAQLNAQLSAQGDQTNAQLEAQQISANAQTQHDTDAAAVTIAQDALQGHLYEDALNAQTAHDAALAPAINELVTAGQHVPYGTGQHPFDVQAIQNELALLLTRGGAAGSLPPSYTPTPNTGGFSISIPGIGSLGVHQ